MTDEVPSWQRKLDHRLQSLWMRHPNLERTRQTIRVLLRFSGPIERIKGAGVQIHAVSGDIASAVIELSDLPRIAGSPEIQCIELAQPLMPDQ